ncbi:MAG: SDR family oxidoreductase [Planctomycetes bacterium]|nr:SDR family oxidoreductase [Planctomycetota bacterium]
MGDRILVVGGLTGIGAGVARWFEDRAVVWSRRANGVDAADAGSVQAAAERFLAEHGAPFGLVHAVGDFDERPLLGGDAEHDRHMLASNLTSALNVTRALVPSMVAAGRGRVVLFGAAGCADPSAKLRAPVYFAVKAALASLVRSLALEVAPAGVTVNLVSPGIIRHPHSHAQSQDRMSARVPMERDGAVDDLRGVVELLLGDGGAYLTGEELTVDGGLRLLGASS